MEPPQERDRQGIERKQRPGFRDIWELIVKIIIILLVIAWFISQYLQNQELNPIALIFLLILLAFLIWLIIRQRHVVKLRCALTGPTGCVKGDPQILAGRILEPILGSAYGLGFSHYLLEVRDPDMNLLSGVVLYPDGGGNPDPALTQGNTAVNPGTLGWVDVEKAVIDAGAALFTSTTFEITLRVFGVDNSELTPPCTTTFDISVNEVYIKRVSTPWSVDFSNPNEPLRKADDPSAVLATVGGNMHVRGAADIYGCANEKVQEYTLWAIPDPTFSFAQPPALTAVVPQADWVQLAHIQFNAQTVDGTNYTADEVRELNVLDGDPLPDILNNVWGVRLEQKCVMIDSIVICPPALKKKVPSLKPKVFGSKTALAPHKIDPSHAHGTGKFTFLLQVIDTNGHQFYDIQRAWIDNENIVAQITGIAGLQACADLYTQDSDSNFKTVAVEGTAWDPLIDPSETPNAVAPFFTQPTNDNFDRYKVWFKKQGAAGEALLIDSTDTVPPRPNPVGVGTLVPWDLTTVDAGTNPLGLPADQLLGPNEECTYDIILEVWDHTVVNESTVHWSGKLTFPIKIINAPEPPPPGP